MGLEEEIQQSSFKSEHQKLLINLIYTNNHIINKMNSFFKAMDLTRQQYNVLRILRGQHPQPVTVNEIKERMLDKMSDASRIVQRLKSKNLVECSQDKEDRRALAVGITKKGLHLLKDTDEQIGGFEHLLENLSTEEANQLNILLDKLRGRFV